MNGIDTTGFSAQQIKWHRLNGPNTKTCKMCGAPVTRFVKKNNNYWDWCSNKCMGSDPQVLAKKRKTNKERHGDEAPQRLDWVKEKQAQTMIKNHGVANAFQSEEIMGRVREQWVEKYGVDNPSKNKEVIEVIRQKALERDWETVLNKRRETNYRLFGSSNNSNAHITAETRSKLESYDWLYNEHVTKKRSCEEISRTLEVTPNFVAHCLNRLGIELKFHNTSSDENEIAAMLSEIVEFRRNVRRVIGAKELDIVVDNAKVAIELNGQYFHSERNTVDTFKHYNKSKALLEKLDYVLYHVKDVEWRHRRQQVEAIVKKAVGYYDVIDAVYQVNEISADEFYHFADANMVCCDVVAEQTFALYHDGEIVAVCNYSPQDNTINCIAEKLGYLVKNVVQCFCKHVASMNNKSSMMVTEDADYPVIKQYHASGLETGVVLDPTTKYFYLASSMDYVSTSELRDVLNCNNPDEVSVSELRNHRLNRIWNSGHYTYHWSKDNK